MSKFLKMAYQAIRSLANDEEGAQVIEYALIIAVISIALVIALRALAPGADFTTFIARVSTCLTSAACA